MTLLQDPSAPGNSLQAVRNPIKFPFFSAADPGRGASKSVGSQQSDNNCIRRQEALTKREKQASSGADRREEITTEERAVDQGSPAINR